MLQSMDAQDLDDLEAIVLTDKDVVWTDIAEDMNKWGIKIKIIINHFHLMQKLSN